MRFDGLHEFQDGHIVHQTIFATWFAQDDIEVCRWANGKFMERTRGTYEQFETIRKHFAPHFSRIRYVRMSVGIPEMQVSQTLWRAKA